MVWPSNHLNARQEVVIEHHLTFCFNFCKSMCCITCVGGVMESGHNCLWFSCVVSHLITGVRNRGSWRVNQSGWDVSLPLMVEGPASNPCVLHVLCGH